MRVLLFALMIALLPLRGWVSDAMATSMAVAELDASSHRVESAIKSRAVKAYFMQADGIFDVKNALLTGHPHAMASLTDVDVDAGAAQNPGELRKAAVDCAGHAGNPNDAATSDACGACSACLTCHVSAIQGSMATLQAFALPRAAPRLERRRFASADTAPSQKPPIS